jgi:arylsulfatase A-like enzyme
VTRRAGVLLLCAGLAICCRRGDPPAARPRSAVLVTVDTLRADHLGFAGYPRDTSPHLDALAREGTAFPWVYSVSATTGASHASLFTSLYPHQHGVVANRQRFPRGLATLMRALRSRGYRTAGFVSSVVVGRKMGLQDEFDHFDDLGTTAELNRPQRPERPAAATLEAATTHLAGLPADTPFLLWVHLIDPHGPYAAPEQPDRFVGDAHASAAPVLLPIGSADWVMGRIPAYQVLGDRREADFYVARYDAEIRYADEALGRFFARLRALGRWDDTLVVVTADHGETLAEPGHKRYFAHGTITYDEVVRIPLVVREPHGERRLGSARAAGGRAVTSLDVAPTVLDLLGHPPEPAFRGKSLLRGARPVEPVFSFGAYGTELLEKTIGTQFSVLQGPWRYVVNSQDGSEELYDHRDDAAESRNLASEQPAQCAALRAALDVLRSERGREAPSVEMTPEHRRALRSLGYVQ